jgi:hypothetical protein
VTWRITSPVLNLFAARGSVASFTEATGEFVDKDVAVVPGIADELGADLGALDDVIKATGIGSMRRAAVK